MEVVFVSTSSAGPTLAIPWDSKDFGKKKDEKKEDDKNEYDLLHQWRKG